MLLLLVFDIVEFEAPKGSKVEAANDDVDVDVDPEEKKFEEPTESPNGSFGVTGAE